MRIVVTGAAGLLGYAVYSRLKERHEVIACSHKASPDPDFHSIDVVKPEDLERLGRCDAVVHCAALTNVDLCEKEPDLAYRVNLQGTANVLNFAKQHRAYFIYISTDYVFDGAHGNYKEEEKTNPINVYGKSKLEGERVALEYEKTCVLRTCGNFGWKKQWQKHNFVSWVIESLESGKDVRIASDLYYSPVLVDFCAEVIEKFIIQQRTGIFHCGSRNCISRLEFVEEICGVFSLKKELVKAIKAEELNLVARRPVNSSLCTEKLSKVLHVPTTREMLERMKACRD